MRQRWVLQTTAGVTCKGFPTRKGLWQLEVSLPATRMQEGPQRAELEETGREGYLAAANLFPPVRVGAGQLLGELHGGGRLLHNSRGRGVMRPASVCSQKGDHQGVSPLGQALHAAVQHV